MARADGPSVDSLAAHVPDSAALKRYRTLFNSVRAGDEVVVRKLLSEGMDINLRGPRGATPLHIAARFGQAAMVDLLLSHGADAAVRDDRGASPIDKARASGLLDISARLSESLRLSVPSTKAAFVRRQGASSQAADATHPADHRRTVEPDRCRRLLEAAYRGEASRLWRGEASRLWRGVPRGDASRLCRGVMLRLRRDDDLGDDVACS